MTWAGSGGAGPGPAGLRPEGGLIYTIIVAVIGAVILTWIYRKATPLRLTRRAVFANIRVEAPC